MGCYFQDDYWEASKCLPEGEREAFCMAVLRYMFEGMEPEGLTGGALGMFTLTKTRIDAAAAKSRAVREGMAARREGTPKVPQGYPEGTPEGSQRVPIKNKKEKENKSKKSNNPPFTPPTVEQVRERLDELKASGKAGYEGIDPEQFVAYYGARGWRYRGGMQMKDWKQALVTWRRKDDGNVGAGDGRHYDTPDMFADM